MKIYEVEGRNDALIQQLLTVWEASVRATHLFLSEAEIAQIKAVAHLIVVEEKPGEPIGFMGVENGRLEMLFLLPKERGQGLGKSLLQMGMEQYGVTKVTVNEQNPQAVGFYEHMGFVTHKRTDHDEEGNPYPLLYMNLEVN